MTSENHIVNTCILLLFKQFIAVRRTVFYDPNVIFWESAEELPHLPLQF